MIEEFRRTELRTFLKARRGRLKPDDVGLPGGGYRRVPGLRREEVASLSGVSVTWYTMFEVGTADNVSVTTIDAIAKALRLSAPETDYLITLATGPLAATPPAAVDPLALRMLQSFISAPAYVITTTWDVLAWNEAFSIVWGLGEPHGPPVDNVLRTIFTPTVRAMHGEHWADNIAQIVAMARLSYARRRGDTAFSALIQELLLDPDFSSMWRSSDIAEPLASSHAEIVSPGLGHFAYEVINLPLPSTPDHILVVEIPDTPSEARLTRALRARRFPADTLDG
jgi:transcriptional regulator with XRE-family HTH domain